VEALTKRRTGRHQAQCFGQLAAGTVDHAESVPVGAAPRLWEFVAVPGAPWRHRRAATTASVTLVTRSTSRSADTAGDETGAMAAR